MIHELVYYFIPLVPLVNWMCFQDYVASTTLWSRMHLSQCDRNNKLIPFLQEHIEIEQLLGDFIKGKSI